MVAKDSLPNLSGFFEEVGIASGIKFHIRKDLPSLKKDAIIYPPSADQSRCLCLKFSIPSRNKSFYYHGQLNVLPGFKPIKQKTRGMVPDKKMFLRSKVQKLCINIIKEVHYSKWVANIVLITKKNGQWLQYIDYMGVKRVFPKDQ